MSSSWTPPDLYGVRRKCYKPLYLFLCEKRSNYMKNISIKYSLALKYAFLFLLLYAVKPIDVYTSYLRGP